MPHEVVQTLCCPLPASPSLSSWEGPFPGAMSPPSSFQSLDFGHDGGRGVPAHCHPREGCGAMLLPCPVPPPQVDHPGLSDHSQDVLAVVPTVWGGWSPARWPKAAEDPMVQTLGPKYFPPRRSARLRQPVSSSEGTDPRAPVRAVSLRPLPARGSCSASQFDAVAGSSSRKPSQTPPLLPGPSVASCLHPVGRCGSRRRPQEKGTQELTAPIGAKRGLALDRKAQDPKAQPLSAEGRMDNPAPTSPGL